IQELQDIAAMADQSGFVANAIVRKMSTDLQSTLLSTAIAGAVSASTTYTVASSGVITYNDLVKAMTTHWGEYAFDSDTLFIAAPQVVYDLSITDQALKAQLYGASPTVTNGIVRTIAGAQVLSLKDVPVSAGAYSCVLLKRDQLG